ncbi:MAG: hypothetical protein DCC58_07800 [Chloroflexi bacterium]|nr:MAG: hypothetical protein DCC58_07800 [Chloroflexota bacterium]
MATSRWTAVIINYNGADYLGACLDALAKVRSAPAEILVVDNASTDDSLAELVAYPRAIVLPQPRNLGFAGGANAGLAAVETELALLLNPDVELASDFGTQLVAAFDSDRRLGAAGALLLYPDGTTVQHAGGVIAWPQLWTSHRGHGAPLSPALEQPLDVDYVAGGALALRMDAVRSVDGFDESFYPAFFEDADLCLRLREAGWAVRYLPALRALHHEGATLGQSPLRHHYSQVNRIRFARKHLDATTWRRNFVPAETERIRHLLAEATGADWPATSGFSGIEAALRNPDAPAAGAPPLSYHATLLPGVHDAVEAARVAATLPERRTPGKPGLAARMQQNLAASQRIEDALLRQEEFNRAVVAALEAQDKLNREQLATLLTLALDILQFVPANRPPNVVPLHPPEETAGES